MPAQGDGSVNLLLVGMKNLSLSHVPRNILVFWQHAAHAKGQTSSALVDRKGLDATGVGVFLCITPHTQTCCYFEQSSAVNTSSQKNCNIANSASILFTRYFASEASAQGTEIHKQLSLYHNHAALQCFGHMKASGSPILPVKCRARVQPTQTDSVDYVWPFRIFQEESLRKYWEVGCVKKYTARNSYSLDSRKTSSVWNFWVSSETHSLLLTPPCSHALFYPCKYCPWDRLHMFIQHSAAWPFMKILWTLLQRKCSDSEQLWLR